VTTITLKKSDLKLCNRATYTFAASTKGYEYEDVYYASYDATDDQVSLSASQKEGATSTIRLELTKTIPDTYKVTLVGIKCSTNKLLQSEVTSNTTDLTGDGYMGADEITKTMLLGDSNSYRQGSSSADSVLQSDKATLDLNIGSKYVDSVVYALGYATVQEKDSDSDRVYTIYTDLYVGTYNGLASTSTAE
jgi:hypothetical protein